MIKIIFRFHCVTPNSILIHPFVPQGFDNIPACRIDPGEQRYPVHFGSLVELFVEAKDQLGRTFDNISSLIASWEISETKLAKIESPKQLQSRPKAASDHRSCECMKFFKNFRIIDIQKLKLSYPLLLQI